MLGTRRSIQIGFSFHTFTFRKENTKLFEIMRVFAENLHSVNYLWKIRIGLKVKGVEMVGPQSKRSFPTVHYKLQALSSTVQFVKMTSFQTEIGYMEDSETITEEPFMTGQKKII